MEPTRYAPYSNAVMDANDFLIKLENKKVIVDLGFC